MTRQHGRLKGVLPVRVTGTNAGGENFTELVHTLNISHAGVCLAGFRSRVQVGDVVDLQYKNQRAPFRVIWFRDSGADGARVGLQCLDPAKKIWGLTFPRADNAHEKRAGEPRQEQQVQRTQRSHTRYEVSGGAEIRLLRSEIGQWAQVTNISMNGCFCETKASLPVFTRVRILLKIDGSEIDVYGVVRSHRPNKGVGIQFTEFVTTAEAQRLRTLIEKLQQAKAQKA